MLISCPRCETTFELPAELFKPGKKARCSQCGLVFPMAETQGAPAGQGGGSESAASFAPAARGSFFQKYRKALMSVAAVALLSLLGYGGWLIYGSYSTSSKPPQLAGDPVETGDMGASAQSAQTARETLDKIISLDDVRQFFVDNAQIGKVMVIQGVAVNVSDVNRDYVAIEARLLDAQGRVVMQVQQLCGVTLTLFQLQSLSAAELKEALNNRITILTNNTNIQPGGKVYFVVVFPNPPESMRTFEVQVTDVRESPVS